MKKLLALFAALVLASGSFVSCSEEPSGEDTSSASEQSTIGVEDNTSAPVLDNETAEEQEEEPYTYKRVVIFGVDGGGIFFQNTDTPNIDEIFADGSIAYDCTTSTPSISAQCWGAMLHGVTPELHRLNNSIVSATPYDPESLFPSVFRVIRENDPDCELASFATWNPINIGIVEDGLDVHKDTADNDAALCKKICDYVAEHDPKLLFIQFDQCDAVGHSTGYNQPAHLKQITTTDGYIGQVFDAYEERGMVEDTLFILTADHGGSGTSHGGSTPEEMNIIYAVRGETVIDGGAAVDMQVRDNASVVLHALGYEQPETWTSMVPSGIFEGVEAGERPVYEIQYAYEHRTHENVATPAADGGSYITDVLGDRITAYLPLDGNVDDAVGGKETTLNDKLYFVEGYFGEGARFEDGSVTLKDFKPGTDSFSIALWFKTDGVTGPVGDPCFASNSDWSSGLKPGFNFCIRNSGDVKFNVGNGTTRMDCEYLLPLDFSDGWVHVILSVDREANTVSFCYDFGTLQVTEIPDDLKESSFSAYPNLTIGKDGSGKYAHLTATLDDFILIDGALTQDDVAALAAYYGAEK